VVIQSLRRVSTTSSISSCPMDGGENARNSRRAGRRPRPAAVLASLAVAIGPLAPTASVPRAASAHDTPRRALGVVAHTI
jgi:hypothetical protein